VVAGLAIAAAVLGAVIVASCAGGDKPDSGAPPSSPTSAPRSHRAGAAPPSAAANAVTPEHAVDLRPVPWQRAEPIAGGTKLDIHATLTGGPPCTVVGRVDVEETAEVVTITLWTGRRPGARCGEAQRLVGFPITVAVALERPLGRRAVRDGASDRP
jgi:hypothetical protein